MSKPILAVTQGDPAGIGPEICLRALARADVYEVCAPVTVGDQAVLRQAAERFGLPLPAGIIDCGLFTGAVTPGVATREAGAASYGYVERAIQGALGGEFAGVVTAPITKTAWNLAGIKDPGHTEVFGRLTGTDRFAMMLYSPRLAVSFVTCHQSLRSVPDALTTDRILEVIELTGRTLSAIRGKAHPKIAVPGLNPHAGEDGMFGDEEQRIIAPAIARARELGWDVEGPIPPDAAFMPRALARFDGHVTMYHDQGSIPFKMISLEDGVNITMGLRIIRTSVDHGTAYDIAWQGKADESSLVSAIRLAALLARAKS